MVTDAAARPKIRRPFARARCVRFAIAVFAGAASTAAIAQSLAAKARESGCVDAPKVVVGGGMYRCNTASGAAAYFNLVPGDGAVGDGPPPKRGGAANGGAPSPPTFPKVDATTQRNRDDMRRKVLGDELAAEEKLLAEARTAYASGAPPALPEEQSNPQKYAERIAKLRQAVVLHERNIEALRRELSIAR